MKKTIALGIVFLFIVMSFTSISSIQIDKNIVIPSDTGEILYIGGSGEGNYSKIQDAIDNASDGDTVFVYDDSSPYIENVVLDKSINLIGEDRNTTVIDGNESGIVVSISADWVNISGFTIQNCSYGYNYGGIKINTNHNIIRDNNICLNSASGIVLSDYNSPSNNNTITGNNITSNNVDGISFRYYSNNNIIIGNVISKNDRGIGLRDYSSNNIIKNNKINSNKWYGIGLSDRYGSGNNTITGNNINSNNDNGIELHYSSNNHIIGNNICLNNEYGIYLIHSNDINITANNIISNNKRGIYLPSSYPHSYNNTIKGNHIISNNYEGIYIHWSGNNKIIGNNIRSNNRTGIFLIEYSNYNVIKGNTIISNNGYGIYISSESNTVIDNNITKHNVGLYLISSKGSTISGNYIFNNSWALNLSSSCNHVTGNKIFNNSYGISIKYSVCGNILTYNNIISNSNYGICLFDDQGSNNIFYHNNFISNTQNVIDVADNIWDNGYLGGGNYWDDYIGTDNDGDGIGDTPYPIPGGNNEDRYPFIIPNGWTNTRPNPPMITGPINVRKGVLYEYNFSISDPDGDLLWIRIDWGNGTPSKWDGPFPSDSIVRYNYSWSKKGTYILSAQTMDSNGLLSNWGILEITIPRTRVRVNNNWYYWLLERLPIAERLLDFLRIICCSGGI